MVKFQSRNQQVFSLTAIITIGKHKLLKIGTKLKFTKFSEKQSMLVSREKGDVNPPQTSLSRLAGYTYQSSYCVGKSREDVSDHKDLYGQIG